MKTSFPFDTDGFDFMMNRVTRNEDELRRRRCGGEKKLKGMLQ